MPRGQRSERRTVGGVVERRCNTCGEFKPEAEAFTVQRYRQSDGAPIRRGRCRECESRRISAYQVEQWRTNQAWRKRRAKQKARANELRVIDVRLARERQGMPLTEPEPEKVKPTAHSLRLPSWPFMVKVSRLIARDNRFATANDPMRRSHFTAGAREHVCRWLAVEPRSLKAWQMGERTTIDFDVLDRALTRSGWNWFDIYDESTVRLRLEVRLYALRRQSGNKTGRDRVGTRWYGDFGADLVSLGDVERAFMGESELPERPAVVAPAGCPEWLGKEPDDAPHKQPGYESPQTVEDYFTATRGRPTRKAAHGERRGVAA